MSGEIIEGAIKMIIRLSMIFGLVLLGCKEPNNLRDQYAVKNTGGSNQNINPGGSTGGGTGSPGSQQPAPEIKAPDADQAIDQAQLLSTLCSTAQQPLSAYTAIYNAMCEGGNPSTNFMTALNGPYLGGGANLNVVNSLLNSTGSATTAVLLASIKVAGKSPIQVKDLLKASREYSNLVINNSEVQSQEESSVFVSEEATSGSEIYSYSYRVDQAIEALPGIVANASLMWKSGVTPLDSKNALMIEVSNMTEDLSSGIGRAAVHARSASIMLYDGLNTTIVKIADTESRNSGQGRIAEATTLESLRAQMMNFHTFLSSN